MKSSSFIIDHGITNINLDIVHVKQIENFINAIKSFTNDSSSYNSYSGILSYLYNIPCHMDQKLKLSNDLIESLLNISTRHKLVINEKVLNEIQ